MELKYFPGSINTVYNCVLFRIWNFCHFPGKPSSCGALELQINCVLLLLLLCRNLNFRICDYFWMLLTFEAYVFYILGTAVTRHIIDAYHFTRQFMC